MTFARILIRRRNSPRGVSLVELLVCTLVMGFISAGIIGIVYLNHRTVQKVENRSDGINSARKALEQISRDVRQARSVGDYYGMVLPPTDRPVDAFTGSVTTDISVVHDDALDQGALAAGTASLRSPTFPSPGDPFYSVSMPGWPAGSFGGPPYTLNPDTLIVQVPVFDATSGFPVAVPLSPTVLVESMDTYVYRVVPDTVRNDGTSVLQVAGFPGQNSTMPVALRMQPKTLLTGIIGPRDQDGNLIVFRYLPRGQDQPILNPAADVVSNIAGIMINFEILNYGSSNNRNQTGGQQSVVALKSEVFMRNNTLATLIAPPPGP